MKEAVITETFRSTLPAVAHGLLGLDKLEQTYSALQAMPADRPFADRLLDRLEVRYRVPDADLAQIPRRGPAILVVNHPFGILEGAVLAALLRRVRPDTRFLANSLLNAIPEIRDLLIPVDPFGGAGAVRANRGSVRAALEFLQNGGLLVVFPSGEVSHFDWHSREVADPKWNATAARLVDTCSRNGVSVPVIPAYIHGQNSLVFQTLGTLHPRLRTAMLARELLNKRRRVVDLSIGSQVSSAKLLEIPSAEERTQYLRWRTYLLARRNQYKPRTAFPLRSFRNPVPQAIAEPEDPRRIASEVAALPRESRLDSSGDLEVFLTSAQFIPGVLQEIGRLREETFRAVGEGTGKPRDLDRFDDAYLHLFVWNSKTREIVGAYRLASTAAAGLHGLYTSTLFNYGEAFLKKLGPALELGRSFVRPEYQKSFAPLLLLWKGIGRYVARNPQYKVLFGPVSISNQYHSVSRELMVRFLERFASLADWRGLVTQRNPYRARSVPAQFPGSGFDIEDLSEVVSDLEPSRAGVPVLLRQYLRLGGKLLAFNVDPEFSNALDGLILVDLTQTEPRLLERYLGKQEAAQFIAYQKGQYATF